MRRDFCSEVRLFDKSAERWEQYYQRFVHRLDVYNVSSDEKRRACLLSWVGPETYALLQNLFGDEDISRKSLQELTEQLFVHFNEVVHVQAARYAFYNCKMQPGQSYSEGQKLCGEWQETPGSFARVSDATTLVTSNRFETL